MSKTKAKMNQQIDGLRKVLESFGLKVYEDEVREDEEALHREDKKEGYHFFVFTTGDMNTNEDLKSINQEIAIYYYSENRDDLDERTIDIILALKEVPMFTFDGTFKERLKRKDAERYVDRIVFIYNRRIILGGTLNV